MASGARRVGPAQKRLDLNTGALRPRAPEHAAKLREARRLGNRDAIDRDRIGRQHEVEEAVGDRYQRTLSAAREIQLAAP